MQLIVTEQDRERLRVTSRPGDAGAADAIAAPAPAPGETVVAPDGLPEA